jgi:hypothetical protein
VIAGVVGLLEGFLGLDEDPLELLLVVAQGASASSTVMSPRPMRDSV